MSKVNQEKQGKYTLFVQILKFNAMKTVVNLGVLLLWSATAFGQLNLDQLLVENKSNPRGITIESPPFQLDDVFQNEK